MPKMISQRGTVILETSMVTPLIVMMSMVGITISILGFQQITLDSSSYFAAKVYTQSLSALSTSPVETAGLSASGASQVKALFGNSSAITVNQISLTDPGIGKVNSFSQSKRINGATLVLPQPQGASVQASSMKLQWLSPIKTSGIAIEPDLQIVNPTFNVQGNTSYKASSPGIRYWGTGMDLPPYYMSQNIEEFCPTATPWNANCPKNWEFRGYGVAEYLNADNIGDAYASIQSGQGTSNSDGTQNVFSAILCHQQIYAYIASILPVTMPQYTGSSSDIYNETASLAADDTYQTQPFKTIDAWDAILPNNLSTSSASLGSHVTNPLKGCP